MTPLFPHAHFQRGLLLRIGGVDQARVDIAGKREERFESGHYDRRVERRRVIFGWVSVSLAAIVIVGMAGLWFNSYRGNKQLIADLQAANARPTEALAIHVRYLIDLPTHGATFYTWLTIRSLLQPLLELGADEHFAVLAGALKVSPLKLDRAARNAVELARLTREHDLPMWRALGIVLEGVAKAEVANSSAGSPTCVAAPTSCASRTF